MKHMRKNSRSTYRAHLLRWKKNSTMDKKKSNKKKQCEHKLNRNS